MQLPINYILVYLMNRYIKLLGTFATMDKGFVVVWQKLSFMFMFMYISSDLNIQIIFLLNTQSYK